MQVETSDRVDPFVHANAGFFWGQQNPGRDAKTIATLSSRGFLACVPIFSPVSSCVVQVFRCESNAF